MTADQKKSVRLTAFGEFVFDRESDELLRSGERVFLQPKPARLLALLLSRPGRLLNQQEIAGYLWPDSVVEYEQRIRSAIRDIRVALGDDPDRPQFVETVPRRGYRFIYPIQEELRQRTKVNRWLVASGIILLAALAGATYLFLGNPLATHAAKPVVVAVLPVQDQSQADYPVDGLTHELIATMAQLDPASVTVIGRTSAMKFKDTDLSPAEISGMLGADYLLETSLVQSSGTDSGHLQLVTTLIDPATGAVVWAATYADAIDQIERLEYEIQSGVSATLIAARGRPIQSSAAFVPHEATAYQAYVKGLALLNNGGDDRALSYRYFREAIEKDPKFARAYIGIARSAEAAGKPASEATEAIQSALELDANLGEAYYMRAVRRFVREWDWTSAGQDFETAIRLEPGRIDYHFFYAAFLRAAGDYAHAEKQADVAMAGEPLSGAVYGDNAWLLLSTGRYKQAIDLCQRGLEIKLPNPDQRHFCLLLANMQLGNQSEAADEARQFMALSGADKSLLDSISSQPPSEQITAFWRWRLDQIREAPPNSSVQYLQAQLYSVLGHKDAAISALQHGLASHEFGMVFMMGDVMLAPLRDDPRFIAIAQQVGIPSALRLSNVDKIAQ